MQILHEQNKVPPGGWRYTVDGQTFRGTSLPMLIASVREYYFSNKKIPPKDLDMIIQDQICKSIPDPERKCADGSPPTKAELLVRAAKAMFRWAASGFKTTTAEELVERRDICQSCSSWQGESAFGIGRCGSCGCYGLKLYVASEKCPKDKWKAII